MLKGSKILLRQEKTIFSREGLLRSKHCNEGLIFQCFGLAYLKDDCDKSQIKEYPAAEQLPLPINIQDLASSEKLKFSPLRNRDISGSFISSWTSSDVNHEDNNVPEDDRVECYDCKGAINLSSSMQTNVPYPFTSKGKPTHLNMPGGQWKQNEKYMSDDLHNFHHTNSSNNGDTLCLGFKKGNKHSYLFSFNCDSAFNSSIPWATNNLHQFRSFSTNTEKVKNLDGELNNKEVSKEVPVLSNKEKLKAVVKEYGAVAAIFHIGFSIISLGCCWLIVISGVDLSYFVKDMGASEGATSAAAAAQFLIAYALHKALAPGRIAVTLTSVPFIVKKLRKMGFLKGPGLKTQ